MIMKKKLLGELESSVLKEPEDLPFPKWYLQGIQYCQG
jgi:hypothetical protein